VFEPLEHLQALEAEIERPRVRAQLRADKETGEPDGSAGLESSLGRICGRGVA
jgi:hypothetical protein